MKKGFKKTLAFLAGLLMVFSVLAFAACGSAIPEIGENGNWWVNGKDTGVSAQGPAGNDGVGKDGHTPEFTVGTNGNWFVDGIDTLQKAQGNQGDNGNDGYDSLSDFDFYIAEDGYLWINGIETDIYLGDALPLRRAVQKMRITNDVLSWETQLKTAEAEFNVYIYADNGIEKGELVAETVVKRNENSVFSLSLWELEPKTGSSRLESGAYIVVVSYNGGAEEGTRLGNGVGEEKWNYKMPEYKAIFDTAVSINEVRWKTQLPAGFKFTVTLYANNEGASGTVIGSKEILSTGNANLLFDINEITTVLGDYFVTVSYEDDIFALERYQIVETESAVLSASILTKVKYAAIESYYLSWYTDYPEGTEFTVEVYSGSRFVASQSYIKGDTGGVKGFPAGYTVVKVNMVGGTELTGTTYTVRLYLGAGDTKETNPVFSGTWRCPT